MALSFPLSLDSFFRDAGFVSFIFRLPSALEINETGGGELLRSEHGTRLWEGSATVQTLSHRDMEDVAVRLRALGRANASFFATPLHMEQTGQTVALHGVQNGREVRLSELDGGQVLARGRFLAFAYGSSSTRYALHQLVEPLTANGSGVTGWAEVEPVIRPGYAIGADVSLGAPRCKAVIVPGSERDAEHRGRVGQGLSFEWRQTLR